MWFQRLGVAAGRKAEDGPIDPKYPLKETPSVAYIQRTEWNVRDSDATVFFSIDPTLTGGSKKRLSLLVRTRNPACIFGRATRRLRRTRVGTVVIGCEVGFRYKLLWRGERN